MTDEQKATKEEAALGGTVQPTSPAKEKKIVKLAKWFAARPIRLLLLPFTVGVVWHGLHPKASVFTGQFDRPRRWYIDENSLEPNYFLMHAPYDLIEQKATNEVTEDNATIYSLCHGLKVLQGQGVEVPCHRHPKFEIAKVVPVSSAIISEAIVLVVPPFIPFSAALQVNVKNVPETKSDKSRPQFQASILQLIRRLASPQTTPWLAKTVFVVSPIRNQTEAPAFTSTTRHPKQSMSPLLEETVDSFLDSYLGTMPSTHSQKDCSYRHSERLPLDYTGAIIRSLLVLDLETFPSQKAPLPKTKAEANLYKPDESELRIMPQGHRGVLPNMDLMFLVMACYDRSNFFQTQQLSARFNNKYKIMYMVVHPYRKIAESWWEWLKEKGLPTELHEWSLKMLNLLSFESIMALGPYPPHAPALDRGIDALTVQGVFVSATHDDDYNVEDRRRPRGLLSPQEYAMELVEKMEFIIRGLSNLHERLHHSTSLYLLPSHDRFVKHEEYLVPNLLLVIPLLIRVLLLAFRTDQTFRPSMRAAGQAMAITAAWTVLFSTLLSANFDLWTRERGYFVVPEDAWSRPGWILRDYQPLLLYLAVLILLAVSHKWTSLGLGEADAKESIQFAACLLATFVHVSLAFGHVSLAYPSAFLWTPLIAFPSHVEKVGLVRKFVALLLLFVTCPFTLLVPHIFPTYTPYVRYAYIPLHLLFSIQQVLPALVK